MSTFLGRLKGSKLCIDHLGKELTFVCETCGRIPVCSTCISTDHKGHSVTEIEAEGDVQFRVLLDYDTDTEQNTIPNIEKKVKDADDNLVFLEESIRDEIEKVEKKACRVKEIIEKWKSSIVADFEEIIRTNRIAFEKFENDSNELVKKLKSLIEEHQIAQKSTNNVLICDVAKELSTMNMEVPSLGEITNVKLIAANDVDLHIQAILGTLSHEHYMNNVPKATVAKTQELSFKPTSIVETMDGSLWMCEKGSSFIWKIKDNGTQLRQREYNIERKVFQLYVHPHNDQVYCIREHYVTGLFNIPTGRGTHLARIDKKNGTTIKLFDTGNVQFLNY